MRARGERDRGRDFEKQLTAAGRGVRGRANVPFPAVRLPAAGRELAARARVARKRSAPRRGGALIAPPGAGCPQTKRRPWARRGAHRAAGHGLPADEAPPMGAAGRGIAARSGLPAKKAPPEGGGTGETDRQRGGNAACGTLRAPRRPAPGPRSRHPCASSARSGCCAGRCRCRPGASRSCGRRSGLRACWRGRRCADGRSAWRRRGRSCRRCACPAR